MKTIAKSLAILLLCLAVNLSKAQEVKQDTTSVANSPKEAQLEYLELLKTQIETEERDFLKKEIESVNLQVDSGEITDTEAEALKKEYAKKRAANITNRLTIVDHKIALLERNGIESRERDSIRFGIFKISGPNLRAKNLKKDIRTKEDIVFAIGFNNTLINGKSLSDSPYKLGGSGFVEFGWAWKTRIFKNTNFWRISYGASVQWNKLNIENNQYFVNDNGNILLEKFPEDLIKAKFRSTNLVFPVHLEFGPSKKIERKNYFRYSTVNRLKIGIGGYAGLNIGSIQKLKFKENGESKKDKQRGKFEVNDFVYGISGYLSWGSIAIYCKYDLNPLFKKQAIEQNNISLGLRFNVD